MKDQDIETRSSTLDWLWLTGSMLWITAVILAYYLGHKPFGAEQVQAGARVLLVFTGWLGTLNVAHWLGRKVWSGGSLTLSHRSRYAIRLGLGLGLMQYGLLALGAIGGYWSLLAWIVILLGLPLNLRQFFDDTKGALPRIPSTRGKQALAFFVSLAVILSALRALAPPTAWDSLVYHLTGPKLYLQDHRLIHEVDIPYLGFPQGGAMLFTWAMLLEGPELASHIHFTFMVLTLALTPDFVRLFSSRRSWLLAAFLMAVPSAVLLSSRAYLEWITIFAGLASFLTLAHNETFENHPGRLINGDLRGIVLPAFFAALSINAKYNAIGLVIGLVFAAWVLLRSVRKTVLFGVSVAVFALPFILKSWLTTGNPIYPFFLMGKFWNPLRAYWYSRPGTGLTPIELLVAPWEATIWGIEGGTFSGHPGYGATLGPLTLAFAPLAAIRIFRREGVEIKYLLALIGVAVTAYFLWLVELSFSTLLVQSRLVFPALPFFMMMAVLGYEAIGDLRISILSFRFVAGGLIAAVLVFTFTGYLLEFLEDNPLPVVTGQESQQSYLRRQLGGHYQAMEALEALPQSSEVIFLWEPRSYYCPPEIHCQPDSLLDRWWLWMQEGLTPTDLQPRLIKDGADYVLFHDAGAVAVRDEGLDPFTPGDWLILNQFLHSLISVEVDIPGYSLYRIPPVMDQ